MNTSGRDKVSLIFDLKKLEAYMILRHHFTKVTLTQNSIIYLWTFVHRNRPFSFYLTKQHRNYFASISKWINKHIGLFIWFVWLVWWIEYSHLSSLFRIMRFFFVLLLVFFFIFSSLLRPHGSGYRQFSIMKQSQNNGKYFKPKNKS